MIKCFDVFSEVMEAKSKSLDSSWVINKEHLEILEEYCNAIDGLLVEFEAMGFDVDINDVDLKVIINIECLDVVIDKHKHVFYDLIKRSCATNFALSANENLDITLVFPSIWDRV